MRKARIAEVALLVLLSGACGGRVETAGGGSLDAGDSSSSGGSSGSGSGSGVSSSSSGGSSGGLQNCSGGSAGSAGGSGSSGGGGCTASQFAQCPDGDDYEVDCTCPEGACLCTKNGATVGKVPFAGCPSCGSASRAWSECGFPR